MLFELEIIEWLQSLRNGFLDWLFNFVTMFGEETLVVVVLGIIYWAVDKKAGEKIGFTIFVSLSINSLLKLIISRPRPFVQDPTIQNLRPETATGYSLPSGHTQTAATSYFSIYYNLRRRWLLIVAIVITTLVALSRMYLGAHYLSDVIFGAILGIGIAWALALYYDRIKNLRLLYWILAIVGFVAMILIILINYLNNLSSGVLDAAQYYFDSADVAKMLGTVTGFSIAINFEKKHINFENHRIWWKNILRFIIGLTIIMAVRLGLKAIFGMIVDSETLIDGEAFKAILAVILDYLRYFVILYIGIAVYPLLFKKIGI